MRRDFRLYLDDILEAIHQIQTYVADENEDAFAKDRKTQDAVIRNLEIIGEAAGNLPEHMQRSEPEIDWRKITGLRNILIHEYFGINLPAGNSLSKTPGKNHRNTWPGTCYGQSSSSAIPGGKHG
jgi:uncharacterized protein with HEPN domain